MKEWAAFLSGEQMKVLEKLGPREFYVLVLLVVSALRNPRDKGRVVVFPSHEAKEYRKALRQKCSPHTIIAALKRIRDKGYLRSLYRARPGEWVCILAQWEKLASDTGKPPAENDEIRFAKPYVYN